MALYLHCVICSRKQADGLLSGAAWGRLELPPGEEPEVEGHGHTPGAASVDHPGLSGSTFRACPTCVSRQPNWQETMLVSLGLAPAVVSAAEAQ